MKSQIERDMRPFFEPRSVAIVGSLREEWGEGYRVIKNMLHFGFTGNIYPVNPSYSEVLGIKAYPTVNEVKGPIDLAMVITPPPSVLAILEQCAQKGIKAVIVGTEGFAETGEAGARLQQQLVDMAHSNAMRLIGPNTIGIVNTSNGLITNPYPVDYDRIWKGNIAYGSQTGFVGAQGQPLEDRAYPISKMCDFGNKCDINEDNSRRIESYCMSQGLDVAAKIPFDNTATEAMVRGLPLVEYAHNGVSQQIQTLWETASKMVDREE